MLLAFMGLLLPSRLQSPSLCPVETIAAPLNLKKKLSGAERNRTAVRNTGVDHLVHLMMNIYIFAGLVILCSSSPIKRPLTMS